MSRTTTTAAALLLLLSAFGAGCADKEAPAELAPAEDPGDLDTVEIETEAEAYERATEEIDLDNFAEQLDALEEEIDEDPYTQDG
jgi:predicted outer membrane protein